MLGEYGSTGMTTCSHYTNLSNLTAVDGPRQCASTTTFKGPSTVTKLHSIHSTLASLRYGSLFRTQEDLTFIPHCDRKVSVANDLYPVLYDYSNVTDFYSGWQVLSAMEVADMGVHIRTNMADPEIASAVRSAIRDKRIVDGYVHECFEPIYAAQGFLKHEAALDSIVWYIEHSNSALTRIRRHQGGGRVWLTDEQTGNYHDERAKAAHSGLRRYGVDRAGMIAVCQFLARKMV